MAGVNVVRNVRIPLALDTEIRRIAAFEGRTISNTIQRLLQRVVYEYIDDHEQSMLDYENEQARFNKSKNE